MRIRSKMFALVSSAMAFMAIVAAVYLVSQGSRSRIEAERKVLLGLGDSVRDLIIAVNLLDSGQMDSSSARFDEKRAAAERSFDAIEGLKYLPRVNASLKESVEIIRNLRSLASDDLASLSSAYGALKADSVKYFMSSRETTLPQFYTDEYARKKYGLADVYQRLAAFSTLSAGLTETLVMSSDVIAEKNLLIDKELEEANAKSLAFASSIGAALVALILFMAFVVSRSLAKPIVTIERTIESLGSGDLRERAVVATRDELGLLGGELNDFLESLSASIGEIQSVSKENAELKRVLAQSLAGASSSAVEIDANAASIKRQIEGLDAQIARARSALEEMGKGLSEYARRVEAQDAMIASSSSSIEEVIESIGSISSIAESDREATEGLVKATAESRVVFGVTFEGLSGIAKSVEDINEMASVIQDIASRTNLLAMNAAIEAAHAGESGKGFSVVADEIRKLALAASESSKRIEETIRSVGERMSRAASSRDKSSASFNAMDGQIGKVANSASEIDGHLAGIRDKAGAVLQSMRELRAASKSTAAESSEVEHAASSVSEAMAETTRVSQEVRSNIAEIVVGLGEISSSVQEVASLSEKLGEAGTRLDSAVNAFTI
jgi:methyl-accepting chemotaxis protein